MLVGTRSVPTRLFKSIKEHSHIAFWKPGDKLYFVLATSSLLRQSWDRFRVCIEELLNMLPYYSSYTRRQMSRVMKASHVQT